MVTASFERERFLSRLVYLAADDVEAGGGDLLRAAAAREVVLHGELVQPVRRAADVLARPDPQLRACHILPATSSTSTGIFDPRFSR